MSSSGKHLNQFEHALKRPDTYIGSVETSRSEMWVFDEAQQEIQKKTIKYNPGLLRIFIEILSNAIDNKWRSDQNNVLMERIEITTNRQTGEISVLNDGFGIPAEKQIFEYKNPVTGKISKRSLYPAELFFGYMLSGTNYNDEEKRKTSGRNGMGSKATNVFSKRFRVEHTDSQRKLKFSQLFKNNAQKRSTPKLTPYTGKKDYTKITFIPDYDYFNNYPGLDDDFLSLLKKNAYDCAMITHLKVIFNDETIQVPNLVKYSKLFFPKAKIMHVSEEGNEMVLVENLDGDAANSSLSHVSFVNGISTVRGGVHINEWKAKIFPGLVKQFNLQKRKKQKHKAAGKDFYPYFVLFVRCELENPGFDTQTKEFLTRPTPHCSKLTENIYKKLMSWQVIELIEDKLNARSRPVRIDRSKKAITLNEKVSDANWAGSSRGHECILFITEGLSAKTFVINGISAVSNGHNKVGAMAVKGKFINVQKQTQKRIDENTEIQMLMQVLGLRKGLDYTQDKNFKRLRYGKVAFLTDADDDGIHIRGLLINFFYNEFPSLCKRQDFFQSMSTAVVKLRKLCFYSTADYKKYQKKNSTKSATYFKGLGSHAPRDAQAEFKNPKMVTYFLDGEEKTYMKLGFGGEKEDMKSRKDWILRCCETIADETSDFVYQGRLSISHFINFQLSIFNQSALLRAIPNIYDGFKVSQRKVFYGCRVKNPKEPMNVERLKGSIQEITSYHHGGASLENTIIKMAQGYVGSNNIPLLTNSGMFGSRLEGGEDAAAGRYVSTKLETISKALFKDADDPLYRYLQEDDHVVVEPAYYMPIIPMILVNGANGVASGFATTIPMYNPTHIIQWIRVWLKNPLAVQKLASLKPWYRGFFGQIRHDKNKWYSTGILEKDKTSDWWHIRELPVGLWTNKSIAKLQELATIKDKTTNRLISLISDVKMYNTPNSVHIMIKPSKNFSPDINSKRNLGWLCKANSLNNIIALDENNIPLKFDGPEDILLKFCPHRLSFYEKRKKHILTGFETNIPILENKIRFIQNILKSKIDLLQSDDSIDSQLTERKYMQVDDSFDYLLSMQIKTMTQSRLQTLKKQLQKLNTDYQTWQNISPKHLWADDLSTLETSYNTFLKKRKEE